ncbi:unnamed protein product [Zymoseptoria tritici ST99CH_3D7]|uniref:DUF1308 domain-containing protein n=1 Tax=Zymoseptoria tritici (strain ST99CH_3D7) TaxID=1276538 RepID=A0A1X7RKJ8_ZYMT9|nr:unnamed protein product [Zymoseptoria tritici ST99CH_3D7]
MTHDNVLEESQGAIDETEEDEEPSVVPILMNLTGRAKTLLSELQAFQEHLRKLKRQRDVELAHFRSTVQSELSMLERLASKPDGAQTIHIARSSNLPFLETIWNIAKKSKNLVALQKAVYFNNPSKSLSQSLHHVDLNAEGNGTRPGRKSDRATVDTLTDGGLTWTKVSLVTNTRLLFDLAKQGWQSDGSEDDEEGSFPVSSDDDDDVPLVKTAKELCLASHSYRVRTRKPVVNLVLPRIILGETDEIDKIIAKCRAAGATVFTEKDLVPAPAITDALHNMAADPIDDFSSTLNIDCTILLALVSEFSHAKVHKEPWFHKSLQRQVEIEGNENLLPAILYPALGARSLVCTREAAVRMKEIVDTIGTPSEKARTAILMSDDASKSQSELVDEMQQWSSYLVPKEWQLPIRVIDQDEDECQKSLPQEALTVCQNMTAINRSVFAYGWASGRTTITSNRTVVKQIENDLEKFEDVDGSVWPKIWLCATARSLVGKEKTRRDVPKEVKSGAWPLPDPLKREQQRRNGLDVLQKRAGHDVEDLRPNGYDCDDVIEAKLAAAQALKSPAS